MHNVHRNFRCFLVIAERIILDKVQNYELLANVLSRHSLDESNLVTSVWNPGNVVVCGSWCQS